MYNIEKSYNIIEFFHNIKKIGRHFMEIYLNKSGESGIESYDIGPDYIIITYKHGTTRHYLYTYSSTGKNNVEHMKLLAESGFGLNSFINTYIKNHYEQKW